MCTVLFLAGLLLGGLGAGSGVWVYQRRARVHATKVILAFADKMAEHLAQSSATLEDAKAVLAQHRAPVGL